MVQALVREGITNKTLAMEYLETHQSDIFAMEVEHLDIDSIQLATLLTGKAKLLQAQNQPVSSKIVT